MDVANVRPNSGLSTEVFGLAKFVWLKALNISVRNSKRYFSLSKKFLNMPRSVVFTAFPLSMFCSALPKRGAWAACKAVFKGQSKALRSHRGVSKPLPPKNGSRNASGRQRFVGEELQFAAAMVGEVKWYPLCSVAIPEKC